MKSLINMDKLNRLSNTFACYFLLNTVTLLFFTLGLGIFSIMPITYAYSELDLTWRTVSYQSIKEFTHLFKANFKRFIKYECLALFLFYVVHSAQIYYVELFYIKEMLLIFLPLKVALLLGCFNFPLLLKRFENKNHKLIIQSIQLIFYKVSYTLTQTLFWIASGYLMWRIPILIFLIGAMSLFLINTNILNRKLDTI